ncbi:MAG: hypothetical protein ACKO96_32655, partial [Flammeovirgaceae bacterium]
PQNPKTPFLLRAYLIIKLNIMAKLLLFVAAATAYNLLSEADKQESAAMDKCLSLATNNYEFVQCFNPEQSVDVCPMRCT